MLHGCVKDSSKTLFLQHLPSAKASWYRLVSKYKEIRRAWKKEEANQDQQKINKNKGALFHSLTLKRPIWTWRETHMDEC